MAVVSCLFVVASTLSLIFSTLPVFQVRVRRKQSSVLKHTYLKLESHCRSKEDGRDEEHFFFAVAEAVFVGWFTFEYLIRFVAAPQKWKFVKGGMNVIDLLGITPYFLSQVLSLVNYISGRDV